MAKYKVMVVGMGKRGKHHAAAFQANPNFEVVAICDISAEMLNSAAATLGLEQVVKGSDAAAIAARVKPDVFCFCTMPKLRCDMVKIAVDCGASLVAFEKPIGENFEEALKIKTLIEESGIRAVVSHQHRYGEHYRKVKEIAASGVLGRIQMVYATATGWMSHMMTHMIDYMSWYNDYAPVNWVMGQAAGKGKQYDNHPSPDYIGGFVQYANGVRGYVECGAGAPDQPEVAKWWGKNRIGIQGTEGFAEVLTNGGWRAVTRDGVQSGEGAMNYDADMPPYIQEMADWLNDGKVHECCFANAYAGFEVMMGIVRSAAFGGQAALPLQSGPDELQALFANLSDAPVIANPVNIQEYCN
ncbi:MAG: Gfo/Idh/MocA family oxidoreductase [Victivallaceae bacterium]|nr:Gfo/Idh/MocA family oxidoreductase [Victivallaceae bacterium]